MLNVKTKVFRICALSLLVLMIASVPALAATTVSPNSSMSTTSSKYYSKTQTITLYNNFDDVLCKYKFTPVWRINSSNSIYSVSEASTFTNSAWWSLWELKDSANSWWGELKSGSRYIERYYSEGIVLGWGIGVSGEASIKADTGAISCKTSGTVGEVYSYKYQATVYTGSSWTSCKYSYSLYS